MTSPIVRSFDSSTLWQNGNLSETGIISLKRALNCFPERTVQLNLASCQSVEDIARLYAAFSKDAPTEWVERGLATFDVTPFCKPALPGERSLQLAVRKFLHAHFPLLRSVIGKASLQSLQLDMYTSSEDSKAQEPVPRSVTRAIDKFQSVRRNCHVRLAMSSSFVI